MAQVSLTSLNESQMRPDTISSHHAILTQAKFFARSGHKFFLKATRLEGVGAALDFDGKLKLRRRLEDLKHAHTTGLILTEAQSQPALDIVAAAGMIAMVELGVAPGDLLDAGRMQSVVTRLAHTANINRSHAALAGYLIDFPITQDALRVAGLARVRRRLRYLLRMLQEHDRDALFAIKHRPDTRALALEDEDFIYSEVPALEPMELRDFVVSLHNLADARPVVIEFVQASPAQDDAVAVAFGAGAAGVVAPPVPVPASRDWLGVRMLRAAELLPFMTLNGSCPPLTERTPMVSVVICAYNAERTISQCLESLSRLAYPNYEVIVVDDGSQDRTAAIAAEFSQFRVISLHDNKGLSAARNAGLGATRGEIVAYTDSDCVVDPHWLTFMVRTMQEDRFDGCGGPNYAPHEDAMVAACVAAAPGAPSHVLTGESAAEHLAGCNMAFTRAALMRAGGFDAQFTSAGDDVDICWRMLKAGFRLGYSPAAFVWHFPRNTIKAYFGQQGGYGRAEAMLYRRYPERFNVLRQIKWNGTIPGYARTLPGGQTPRVLWNAPTPGAQTVFDPALRMAAFLPQTFEWTVFWAMAAVASVVLRVTAVPALAMLAMGPGWALYYAWHSPLERRHRGVTARLLLALIAYFGPMQRALMRYRTRLGFRMEYLPATSARQRLRMGWLRREFRLSYWNENHISRASLLDRVLGRFGRSAHPAILDHGWNDHDVAVEPNPWTRVVLKTADEEHAGGKLKNHISMQVRMSRLSHIGLAAGLACTGVAAVGGLTAVAFALGAMTVAAAMRVAFEMAEAARCAYRAIEESATELNLVPLGVPTRAARWASRTPNIPVAVGAGRMSPAELTGQNEVVADWALERDST
ncbi:MAG TPA: glycosyltransferase [Candidatus Binataceae bacterium]|nr:glycosyltransferase [Candidatus Binataceae bacterium]